MKLSSAPASAFGRNWYICLVVILFCGHVLAAEDGWTKPSNGAKPYGKGSNKSGNQGPPKNYKSPPKNYQGPGKSNKGYPKKPYQQGGSSQTPNKKPPQKPYQKPSKPAPYTAPKTHSQSGKPKGKQEPQYEYDKVLPDFATIRNPDSWRPQDRKNYHEMIGRVSKFVDNIPDSRLSPAVENLRTLIETEPRIYMYFTQMFLEIPQRFPSWYQAKDKPHLRNYQHMLKVINYIVTRGPDVDTVGVPFEVVLSYPMGTASGHAAFLDPVVNDAFRKILQEWGSFLMTEESTDVLNDSKTGWFGSKMIHQLETAANAPYQTKKTFDELFVSDPDAKSYGYKSWDEFFTRPYRDDVRPLDDPDDDSVIANACESKAYGLFKDAKLRDAFFIKSQPYSILDMLDRDELSSEFEGATIYQAFLSPLSYHRWHSPVSGTIKRAYLVDGTYFSTPLSPGFYDPTGKSNERLDLTDSQAYLTALAARAVVMIEADNPDIGLMAFIGVGMDEVSSNEIGVEEGQHINKGDELGMFHFGGSSHCLLFRKGVELEGFPPMGNETAANVPLRSRLARVMSKSQGGDYKK